MRRKKYEALRKLTLPPDDWCAILEVRMVSPAGWLEHDKDYCDPVGLPEFARRVFGSMISFEDGATDLNDAENFLAEDGE